MVLGKEMVSVKIPSFLKPELVIIIFKEIGDETLKQFLPFIQHLRNIYQVDNLSVIYNREKKIVKDIEEELTNYSSIFNIFYRYCNIQMFKKT